MRVVFSLLVLLLPTAIRCASRIEAPPLFHTVPPTSFSCSDHPAGYYADMEASCQVYHMCDRMGRQYSYLCPNMTAFNQRFMVCDHWNRVHCAGSASHYVVNTRMAGGGEKLPQAGRMARLVKNNEIEKQQDVKNKMSIKKINMRKLKDDIKNVLSGIRSTSIATTGRTTFNHVTKSNRIIKIGTVAGPRKKPESNTTPRKPFGTSKTTRKPFGTSKTTRKPFGTSKTTRKPFGTSKTTRKPFGTSTTTRKPFGTSKTTRKPFGTSKTTSQPKSKTPRKSFGTNKTTTPKKTFGTNKTTTPRKSFGTSKTTTPRKSFGTSKTTTPKKTFGTNKNTTPRKPFGTSKTTPQNLKSTTERTQFQTKTNPPVTKTISKSTTPKTVDTTTKTNSNAVTRNLTDAKIKTESKAVETTTISSFNAVTTNSVENFTSSPNVTVTRMFPGMVARGSGSRSFTFPTVSNSVQSQKIEPEDFIDNPLFLELTRQILFMRDGFVFPVRNIIGTQPQKIQNNSPKSKRPDGNTQFNIRDPASRVPIKNFVVNELHPVETSFQLKPQNSLTPPNLPTVKHTSFSKPKSPIIQQLFPFSFSVPESKSQLHKRFHTPSQVIPNEIWTTPQPIIMRGPRQEQLTVLEATGVGFESRKLKLKKPISITRLTSHAFYIPENKLAPPKTKRPQHSKRTSKNLESHDSFYYR